MNKPILFPVTKNQHLPLHLAERLDLHAGDVELRSFPDGETYVRIREDVEGSDVIILCTLHRPDPKFLPLVYLSRTARDLGADAVHLVAPYLSYMRQDTRFRDGEGITSAYFADLLSAEFEGLITVDPHLHRYSSLTEIYDLDARVVHASPAIADWILERVQQPLLLGPDRESKQWVSAVAGRLNAPYEIMTKERKGDRRVEMTAPDLSGHEDRTPVVVDDIISTGGTFLNIQSILEEHQMNDPVFIGIHGLFVDDGYTELCSNTTGSIVTCNTVSHETNDIDVSAPIANQLQSILTGGESI